MTIVLIKRLFAVPQNYALVLGLGPLDVQMLDREREDLGSALDAVQALERLNAFSMTAVDSMMQLLVPRTQKKIDTLLPLVLDYSTAIELSKGDKKSPWEKTCPRTSRIIKQWEVEEDGERRVQPK